MGARSVFLAFILLCGLSACLPLQMAPVGLPTPTETQALPTGIPTATIVWFPPTATFTPYPTQVVTPTLDTRPQVGAEIFSDDFSSAEAWTTGQTAGTSIALSVNELSLALSTPGAYVYSLRSGPTLTNFYAEITAMPSLCKGEDEYGLLLRVSPSVDFYRFSLTCNGQARLDKYVNGRASSPQPLTPSGDVPLGAPSVTRLAVWANGREMRFYLNDHYQFTVSDPTLTSGGLGVFARSAGENALTVSFSNLTVHQVTP